MGRRSFHWVDLSREESGTPEPADARELVVRIWYPAEARSEAPRAPYAPDLVGAPESSLESATIAALSTVVTHAVENAAPAARPRRFPVLVFSHGSVSSSALHAALLEDLASHGFAVAAVEHPYDSLAVVLPGGRTRRAPEGLAPRGRDPRRAEERRLRRLVEERARDASFVLDRLAELARGRPAGPFGGRLDLARVGMLGHSAGGVAALRAGELDDRFRALANLDGRLAGRPFVTARDRAGPRQPVLLVEQPRLVAQPDPDVVLLEGLRGGAWRVTIDGAGHESFGDEGLVLPATSSEARAAIVRRTELVRAVVRAFFDRTLRGAGDTPLDRPETLGGGLTVERFGRAAGR